MINEKEDVPQDLGALGKITKEICYATDEAGKYTAQSSNGWDVKSTALDTAWNDVEERIATAKQKVLNNQASPILFFMEKTLMDLEILAGYTGFWQWQIKRHLKPEVFTGLSEKSYKNMPTFLTSV
ncbi:hypothetical protein [Mucilaginibacter antarcticus]|uniref:hypothetical protein n=1 Tax=Mucilaginibacter antarcticus TaxID=1855725 RepID=UPI0036289C19